MGKETPPVSPEEKTFQVTTHTYQDLSGPPLHYERFEATVPVSTVVCEARIREACTTCPRYGKNLSCPPHSPELGRYLEGQSYARVICIRMPRENSGQSTRGESAGECFARAREILVEELTGYRVRGYLIAGSGSCQACAVCVAEGGLTLCRHPDRRIFSLESLGVNVAALARSCFGLDLDWDSAEHATGFICAIGAVFMNDPGERKK